jgi:hypothetical protein
MKIQAVEAVSDKRVSFFMPSGEIDEKGFEKIEEKLKEMI